MKKSILRTLLCTLPLLGATALSAQKAYNTLTTEEAASGYTLLFNGTDLTGWRGWNNMTPPVSWVVVAETTWNVFRTGPGGQAPLVTVDSTYQNFDLKLEFNVPSQGNSGIFIRYNQYGKNEWGGVSGPETQIAATDNSDGRNAKRRNGTIYDMFPLLPQATEWDSPGGTHNYGRYHQLRIIAYNNRVAHYGNGIKLIEYDMQSEAYNTAYMASKYNAEPLYRDVHPGGIYLQHHGEQNISFRNLRIKKLTQSPWGEGSIYLKNPEDSASGLIDSMTHAVNLFPGGTGIAQGATAASFHVKARLLRGNETTLMLDRAGDYIVHVDDLQGRTVFRTRINGSDRTTIPSSALTGETRILRVTTASGALVHRRMLSPVLR